MSAVAVDDDSQGGDRLRPGTTGALRDEGDWCRLPGLTLALASLLPPLVGLSGEARRMEHFLLLFFLLFFLTLSESADVSVIWRILGG